jgi:hypothetical protein
MCGITSLTISSQVLRRSFVRRTPLCLRLWAERRCVLLSTCVLSVCCRMSVCPVFLLFWARVPASRRFRESLCTARVTGSRKRPGCRTFYPFFSLAFLVDSLSLAGVAEQQRTDLDLCGRRAPNASVRRTARPCVACRVAAEEPPSSTETPAAVAEQVLAQTPAATPLGGPIQMSDLKPGQQLQGTVVCSCLPSPRRYLPAPSCLQPPAITCCTCSYFPSF